MLIFVNQTGSWCSVGTSHRAVSSLQSSHPSQHNVDLQRPREELGDSSDISPQLSCLAASQAGLVCPVRCEVCLVRHGVCPVRCEVCLVRQGVCPVRCEVCPVRCEVCPVRHGVCPVRCEVCLVRHGVCHFCPYLSCLATSRVGLVMAETETEGRRGGDEILQ